MTVSIKKSDFWTVGKCVDELTEMPTGKLLAKQSKHITVRSKEGYDGYRQVRQKKLD